LKSADFNKEKILKLLEAQAEEQQRQNDLHNELAYKVESITNFSKTLHEQKIKIMM
jgi:hypothetical protein